MSIDKNTTAMSKAICIICPLIAVAFVSHKFLTVFAVDVPRELREMNMVVFAKAFSGGRNLYMPDVLNAEIPTATNLYGFLAPLIISPFIAMTADIGVSALRMSEILTIVIECIGIYFAYAALHERTENAPYSLIGAIILDSCYWRYAAFGGAFPDQWGLSLGFLLTYLITADEKKGKFHPVRYAFITVLLFYIKQYFVFLLVGAAVYLLLRSVRDFAAYAVSGITFGIISIIGINRLFPLYFAEVFPVAQGSTGNNGIADSLRQIYEQTVWSYKVLALILPLFVIFYCIENKGRMGGKISDTVFGRYEFCQLVCILPFSVWISRNEGTRYTYNLQLWWPYVILFTLSVMPLMVKKVMKERVRIARMIIAAAAIYCLWDCKSLVISTPLNDSQIREWENAYTILDRYRAKGDILVSPHLSSYCLDRDIVTADYGQAEFNSRDSLNGYLNNKLWVTLFPDTERLLRNNIEYNERVRLKIQKHDYSLIALTDSAQYWLNEDDILDAGYRLDSEAELVAGGEILPTRFYVSDPSGD